MRPGARRFFIFLLILFLLHNMAITLFRMVGALTRNIVIANALGSLTMLLILMMGGFVIPKQNVSAALCALRDCSACLPATGAWPWPVMLAVGMQGLAVRQRCQGGGPGARAAQAPAWTMHHVTAAVEHCGLTPHGGCGRLARIS